MSSRNFRRVAGNNDLPPPPDDSDEDYQPLYAQQPGKSKFAGLMLSSNSESEHGSDREEETSDKVAAQTAPATKKKNFKKKGKGKARKPLEELDDIDRSLQEVNAMLGDPPPAPEAEVKKTNEALLVLARDRKHLNVANELRRLFGPDTENNRRARHPSNRAISMKRVLVHPNKDTTIYEFRNTGLTMAKYKEDQIKKYFVFNHSEAYQKMHRAFLTRFSTLSTSTLLMTMEEARANMHVEALLEISDRLFRVEEAGIANEIVENVVTYLQYVAHPLFVLTQDNVRLEYKFMENRPFHVAMLKYIYLLTNKACHRTALEIAKMMVVIDPSDPLAIISIIDVLALRAREHEWLIGTISYFDRHRDACLLYNINYSNALAHFHVAVKNKQDLTTADALLREAILAHPVVLLKILECCKVSNTTVTEHPIFASDPKMPWTNGLQDLFFIYAKMTSPRWNEPPVMNWLMKNVTELCEAYDNDPAVREDAQHWSINRNGLFQVWPPEYLRHVSVLSSMAKLILDAPLTGFYRPTCAWDPLFDKSENRYNYNYKTPRPQNVSVGRSAVYSNDIRNDHLIMLTQLAMHTGCFPQFINFASSVPPESSRLHPTGTGPNVPGSDAASDFNNTPGTVYQGDETPIENLRGNANIGLTFTLPLGSFTVMPGLDDGSGTTRRYVIHIPDDNAENSGQPQAPPEEESASGPEPSQWRPTRPVDTDDDDYEQDVEYDYDDDEENYEKYRKALAEAIAAAPNDETLDGIFKESDYKMIHPTSIFCIIATEFCERFSFCGLRTILSLYLRNVLCLHENAATVVYHIFIMMCYTMPLMGAILADNFIGRYKVILYFSIIYLIGTVLTCCSAIPPLRLPPTTTSMIGLLLIATGTGGIKPCVAAFGGDQFRLPEENQLLQKFFSTFYCTVNLGGFMGMVVTPALRRSVMCFGDDACYALGFGFPALLVLISIVIFVAGKPSYRIKQPRDNVTLKFISCAWYAITRRIKYNPQVDGLPRGHWLDYSVEQYGEKLVADMKVVFSILYLYLPVPIFWSLFDQQGSRWTFQASRLRSEVFGVTLMPDQLQVMNPAMVLLMIPVCPGGAWPLLPDMPPLQKMFIGGMLAAMAFVSAGILQIGIERSTLQVPGHKQTGLVIMNTLGCAVDVAIRGEGIATVEQHGTALMTPLPHRVLMITATSPVNCAGRVMKKFIVKEELRTIAGMFMSVVIGQNSDDQIGLYFMDPNPFVKSLTGKPKLKVVYVGDTGPNKNVSIAVETEKRLSDIYYVSDAPVDHIGESAYMCLQPGKFRWRALSADGEMSGSGEGYLRAGGVYVLCLRERLGRLDAAVLHAPNPPNELHLAWIVPQYLLVSVAEIMFAVSGLEFSFTQAPKSMKTITIAAWYVSVAFGNLIVILVAQTKIFQSRATEFFVYAAMLAIAMLIFLRMAQDYHSRNMDADGSSSESRPLLHHRSKVISVHSLSTSSTRAFGGTGSSAASCLGVMERSRPAAWPQRAYVHLATPSSGEPKATTLAQE
ncbi:uncharacterized protein LOC124645306 [Helicoverpa zea]|uniref:uncharacterized protein LOC124645306 n=1 Tax=Helicoverpa zea TaxID=7113 RepID=UPI001F56D11C|nr:uncharacterized protein LOC124645306 [Helicoverpa zea]